MNARRQMILRAADCRCGCRGKDHPSSCYRMVFDIVERRVSDAYPGIPAKADGGKYVTDAGGRVKYATEVRAVHRIRYQFADGRISDSVFWALEGS